MAQDQYRCGECGATFGSKACGAVVTSERELEEHNREMHPEMEKNRR